MGDCARLAFIPAVAHAPTPGVRREPQGHGKRRFGEDPMENRSFDRRTLLGASIMLPVAMSAPDIAVAQEPTDVLDASLMTLRRLLGQWRGEGDGQPGHSTIERSYAPALGGHFIFARNISHYAPQERNPKGERHEDLSFYSFDRARNRAVLRQFHI